MTNLYRVFAAWNKYKKGLPLDPVPKYKPKRKQKKPTKTKNKASQVTDDGYPCQCKDCKAWRYGERENGCERSKPKDNDWHRKAQWRNLRKKVLDHYGDICQRCGASGNDTEIHVDHIKPRSKYPESAFEFGNLQVLCRNCNFSKNNRHNTDYR